MNNRNDWVDQAISIIHEHCGHPSSCQFCEDYINGPGGRAAFEKLFAEHRDAVIEDEEERGA